MRGRKGPPREQISAGLRFDILRRCNFACYYCGVPAALGLKVLHVDHVVPVSLGGTNDPWNLVAACWDCNLGKAGIAPSPELIEQVRDDYLGTLDEAQASVTIVCVQCHQPATRFEEDGIYDRCTPCVDRDLAIWDLGYRRGSEVT